MIPLASATVLLLGGKYTNAWGHLLGVAAPLASFALGVAAFIDLDGGDEEAIHQNMFTWIQAGSWTVNFDLLFDPLSALFVLLITGVGSLIHIYSVGYMEHDDRRRRFFAYLNLFVAAMLLLVLAVGLPRGLPRLGRRRPGVVPADRLLAAEGLRRGRRQEGLRREPRR